MRDSADVRKRHAADRIEIDAQLIGMIEILGANRVRMKLETRKVRHPHERCRVARDNFFSNTARRKAQRDDVDPVGPGCRRALLKEKFAVDAVRIAHEHVGPVAGCTQGAIRDGEIVASEVELRITRLRKQHFAWIRDGDVAAGDRQHLSFLLPLHRSTLVCNINGVMITHPEKVLFPDDGITKGDLAAYYEAIAPVMLPHLRGRPVTMERYPAGIDKKGFWQKDVSKGFPAWLKRVAVPKKDGVVHHPIVTDTRSLLWVTNQNTITQHVWISRVPDLEYPDICVFDLDPSKEDPAAVRAAAMSLRDLLAELTLPSWIKTSGSKGFHIVVPLDGKTRIGPVARFANAVGKVFVAVPRSAHAGVQQGRSPRSNLRRHRTKRLQRHVCRRVHRAREGWCAGIRAVHMGGS